MKVLREIVEKVHSERKGLNISLKQPLLDFSTSLKNPGTELAQIIKEEVNVKDIKWSAIKSGELAVKLNTKITKELEKEARARETVRMIQAERKKLGTRLDERIIVYLPNWPKEYEEEIKRKSLSEEIKKGQFRVQRKK
jgi:hypothetical protein